MGQIKTLKKVVATESGKFWHFALICLISCHFELQQLFLKSLFDPHTGPHISPENRNYSATDPENSETFPQANSQIYVVLEWFILLLQKHTNTK